MSGGESERNSIEKYAKRIREGAGEEEWMSERRWQAEEKEECREGEKSRNKWAGKIVKRKGCNIMVKMGGNKLGGSGKIEGIGGNCKAIKRSGREKKKL